ncbi:MAG: hypothetical protein WCJ60_02380 [bacterium]
MADNTQLNVGTLGDIIATDDIAGVKHQMVKVEFGALDSATLVSAANPLPIVQTGTPALPTGASTEATLALIKAKTDNIPAQGQALAAASTPVVLTAAQITTLTPPAAITGFATSALQLPNNHNVIVTSAPTTAVTGPLTDAQLRASNVGIALNSLTFPASTNNSSTAQLAASATFTGTIETVLNLQAAQIQIFSDQPYTLNIDQFIDLAGTKLTSTDTFTRLANVPFNENITLPGNYFRLRVQNTGASATTTLQIDTTFGIMATGPRTVTTLGNNRSAINEINGTAVDSNSGVKSAGTMRVVLATDQPALTNKLLVTPDSVALPANQSVNMAQVGGTNTVTGGVAGTLAVGGNVANAVTATANPVPVGGVFTTAPATLTTGQTATAQFTAAQNLKHDVTTINAVTPLMGNGVTGTGSQRVTLASDMTAISTAGYMSVKIDQTTPGTTNAVTDTKLPASAASADALTNPTITQIGADSMLFNGTSWDRQRGMSIATTTGDTGAKVATGNGATQTNVGNKGMQLFIVLGTVSGTTPTCVFKLQGSVDGGTTFYDIPGATTASLVASVNVGITVYPGATVLAGAATTGTTAVASNVIPRTWRVVWTIGGTTPSFTITSVTYNYIPN